jgi:hypothetical protein
MSLLRDRAKAEPPDTNARASMIRPWTLATHGKGALGKFPGQAELINPVLLKALQETNGIISRWAASAALKEMTKAK